MRRTTFACLALALAVLTPIPEPAYAVGPADEDCHDTACWGRKSRAISQENEERRAAQAWVAAVSQCTAMARNYDAGFDAHAPMPGRVQVIGTTQGRYQFQKCMGQVGQPTK